MSEFAFLQINGRVPLLFLSSFHAFFAHSLLKFFLLAINMFFLIPYSSLVDAGMCSGILVSFRLEQSTTLDSQRHLGGHTGSLLQALFRRVSSVPEQETMQSRTLF